MNVSRIISEVLELAFSIARENKYEYITPEVILLALCKKEPFIEAFLNCGGDVDELERDLKEYADEYLVADNFKESRFSLETGQAIVMAEQSARGSSRGYVDLDHLVSGIWKLEESDAVYLMEKQGVLELDILRELIEFTGNDSGIAPEVSKEESNERSFEKYAPCINDLLDNVNPLIGRENELERTIQILCRKDKNNVIHIGEPGVGKTAITYGLAKLINENKIPSSLKGAKIYALDLGSLLAGTQYRGDLEKRLKKMLDEISKEENPIIYIDEIHNLAGAGAVGEGSFDTSNMLKPYLAKGSIRFIGATTFEEYKRYFEKNKSLVRRFQNVEITEPSVEETVEILQGLKSKYEAYHKVKYKKGVLEYAVEMSKKYINERFLPDKAIDLIDEAGAYRKIHPLEQKVQSVGKDIINEILTKICRVPIEATSQQTNKNRLVTLEKRMLSKVFGQDEAITQVVNAIKFSKAGLLEDNKPLSSFLFAGPTGVGKTEIAKTLAEELGVKLVRFDMSEYEEKHAVSKLIGSPAGYVGYEDGGLLTESIRKNPSCVLLLDEIEKAHPDIFNILLQVMDYATLTDNQGRKADFRNVIIIMTSNAGASKLGGHSIGFGSKDKTMSVISEEVKRVFTPEFRNRLNKIVVFSSMTEKMGKMVAKKKLSELAVLLDKRNVELKYTPKAIELLSKKGTSKEYGARDMDRIIQNEIKTLLVNDILFGSLKKGGSLTLDVKENCFVVKK
ncbi:ATP-dependent Clp protease ATP-binding subunit ClpA [Acetitomaculum ruminis DSM 5522]|uniref:ATP-dependent Clp protease ATP-binding subunit ClpA n=1 Tax=Acetitomaculum ruminis DSM 5522 TaxID=1120918 RepID=A0A1I0ZPV2_9FIRM|nr:AAA family ATPase [Acetitomaculum ruminis]SFB27136.1 ATP-dependent Clp protease ATP-binding subunit ClpA [Acetitomaculum ruminis DSM 5522]